MVMLAFIGNGAVVKDFETAESNRLVTRLGLMSKHDAEGVTLSHLWR